ncbi:arfaptin-2-like isoform X1 [Mercenaria mercenaria]|uniref:arfaptin-2-like isoform X1 n=2 Tax=Mercenaria mercenaria TaxID=6596 RepID=UPI00234ED413|nr:arfaptin-2-like isoform X1 [Mercenaria mercenaria]
MSDLMFFKRMADSSIPASMNGMPMDDDEFERNLQEIMDDGPTLSDSSNTVQSGSPQKPQVTQSDQLSDGGGSQQLSMSQSLNLPPASKPTPVIKSRSLNGDFVPRQQTMTQTAHNKLEQVKNWSINTYKCTKQLLSEKLGKGSRTVDLELEAQIEVLRDTKRKYENILRLSRTLANHFSQVVQTQRALGEAFSEQAQRSAELQDEFTYNCETQRALVRNGETLLGAMNFFTSSVNTLISKTMDDTLITVKNYETARLEFDAYRADMEHQNLAPRDSANIAKSEELKRKFEGQKEKYDKLRADVAIKLKFLDENRIKVMHKQLLLFHNAISAYFSGNQSALEATLKQFNIKLKAPNAESPSWLEQ